MSVLLLVSIDARILPECWVNPCTLKDAEALLHYDSEFYARKAAVTKHSYGKGKVYYIGTEPDSETMKCLMGRILEETGIHDEFKDLPDGVEIAFRESKDEKFAFVLNHDRQVKELELPNTWECLLGEKNKLDSYGVNIYCQFQQGNE